MVESAEFCFRISYVCACCLVRKGIMAREDDLGHVECRKDARAWWRALSLVSACVRVHVFPREQICQETTVLRPVTVDRLK